MGPIDLKTRGGKLSAIAGTGILAIEVLLIALHVPAKIAFEFAVSSLMIALAIILPSGRRQ
jgi:hypothetical protein